MEGKNPNETILIPLLNKRVTDLTTANIVLEGKFLYAEEEKKELQDALEAEKARSRKIVEEYQTQFAEKLQQEVKIVRDACEQEKQTLHSAAEASKQTIAENWSRELQTQTGNLKAQIENLNSALQSAHEKIAQLQAEIDPTHKVSAPKTEQPKPVAKKKVKKDEVLLGGDTY